MQSDFDGEADGDALGVPDVEGVPDGESDGLVGVPGELGLGLGTGLPLGLALLLGEGVAVLPLLPCLA
jgi:hypothetical protein